MKSLPCLARLTALLIAFTPVVVTLDTAYADEAPSEKSKPKHDYQRPPLGTWGVAWCGLRGILWVHEANDTWWSFSSEDGTAPPMNDENATSWFNDWIQSGPTDLREIKGVKCDAPAKTASK